VLQIANANVLIAAKVGKGDGLVVEHMDEARVPATMLDIGPTGLAGGGHVKGVAG
jgi:hypothetical protein